MRLQLSHLSAQTGKSAQWQDHFSSHSLHLVLNLTGNGLILSPHTRLTLLPRSLAVFHLRELDQQTVATRFASDESHQCLLLTIGLDSLNRLFRSPIPLLKQNMGLIRRWTSREEQLYQDLLDSPVASQARHPWYQAKILELLTLHLFQEAPAEESFFCSQLKKQTHRHVRQALETLQTRLAEPLDLSELADDVGCAPHYLSRLVKQETGKTLSLHLRAFRIERAAILLAGGSLNVTEAALEVGYNSLSHFSKAFAAEQGMSPSQFLKRNS